MDFTIVSLGLKPVTEPHKPIMFGRKERKRNDLNSVEGVTGEDSGDAGERAGDEVLVGTSVCH